jgi:MFS family permease
MISDVKTEDRARWSAWRFILLVGVTNLFADTTYEGARGVAGDFLGKLGASGTIVGFVAGGGELAGYAVRSVSGLIADQTGRYWIDVWVGYTINMLCVPALALVRTWPAAAGLMIGERLGRGIRRPAMSAILSRAGRDLGSGRVFGINEALDQIGGAIGPLIVAFVLARTHNFRVGFAILLIPALLTLSVLAAATLGSRCLADKFERTATKSAAEFSRPFWIYVAGGALFSAGCADFALIAYHLGKTNVASPALISVWYSVAMVVSAVSAPLFGRLLDRTGMIAVAIAIALSAAATPLAFLGNGWVAYLGTAIWGIGTTVQDSLLVALVAKVTSEDRRSTAYGVFDTIYGVAWLAGSMALGVLYDHYIWGLVVLSVGAQIAAIPVFFIGSVESGMGS